MALVRLVVAFVVIGTALSRPPCGEHETLADGNQWEHTCEYELRDETFKTAQGNCICAPGFVRNQDKTCVTRIECNKQMCDDLRKAPFRAETYENPKFPQCREGESCAVIKIVIPGTNATEAADSDRWMFLAGCF
ncbi:hypothetical protein L596_023165 [Steinernema carpocapsae]|uniref:TIL domain-containing protein n=1 Tax=Steinernema carpocapsae TaxID=34508 RepID=A0A4U5MDM4_STECR|nr:hypothetical protein L596_023165 [Steinernema carpocapsae]